MKEKNSDHKKSKGKSKGKKSFNGKVVDESSEGLNISSNNFTTMKTSRKWRDKRSDDLESENVQV